MRLISFAVAIVLLCCMAPFSVCAAVKYPFPDTGQVNCYDLEGELIICPSEGELLYGQDAQYNSGPPQKFQSNSDGTVSDLNTGLMWQQSDNGKGYFIREVIPYCNDLTLAGYSDWRLPSIGELQSIINYPSERLLDGVPEWSWVHPAFLLNEDYSYYSSTVTMDPDAVLMDGERYKMGIGFFSGRIQYVIAMTNNPDTMPHVICVRNGQTPSKTYTQNNNGSVIDNVTGLEWQQRDDGKLRTWEDALAYCEELSLANHSDWRLPNILELSSIVDYGRFNPAIDSVFQCNSFYYWSSTSNKNQPYRAWVVDFINGTNPYDYLHADGKKGYIGGDETPIFINDPSDNYVRCVRGGQSMSLFLPHMFLLLNN